MCELATSPIHETFCDNVKARRLRLKLTQAEVAERLEIAQPTYAQIESGRNDPGLALISRVAEALETTPEILLKKTAATV